MSRTWSVLIFRPVCCCIVLFLTLPVIADISVEILQNSTPDHIQVPPGYFQISHGIQSIKRLIKLRRMKWVGHIAQMGEGRGM
jgi:hypothetical protein